MKVGIIHGFVGGGGGTETTLIALVEALKQRGHVIHLYTVSKPSVKLPGIEVQSAFPFRLPAFGLYQRYLESELAKKAQGDDIIVQVSGGLALPYREGQRIVIYCHSDFRDETEKDVSKYKGVWSAYYRPYYLLSQRFVSHIGDEGIILVANSRFTQESLKERFGKDSIVIYPPVDTDAFQSDMKKEDRVLTISRYSQEKRLEFALDALGGLDIPYTIIGNTKTKVNEVYYDSLNAKAKSTKPEGNVFLLKNISRELVVDSLKRAKVYFHAAPETFGISVVESMAAGCIPVVPDNSAHRETVPDELRFDPDDLGDARDKIRRAVAGEFDGLLPQLTKSVERYGKKSFQDSIASLIESIA